MSATPTTQAARPAADAATTGPGVIPGTALPNTTPVAAARSPGRDRRLLGYLALLAFFAVLPLAGAYPVFIMKGLCYALFACAFNLLLGFTGLLSFGHAAFLGLAAYTTGHALKVWGLSMPAGVSTLR